MIYYCKLSNVDTLSKAPSPIRFVTSSLASNDKANLQKKITVWTTIPSQLLSLTSALTQEQRMSKHKVHKDRHDIKW